MKLTAFTAILSLVCATAAQAQTMLRCEDYDAIGEVARGYYAAGLMDGFRGGIGGILQIAEVLETWEQDKKLGVPEGDSVSTASLVRWTKSLHEQLASTYTELEPRTYGELARRLHVLCRRQENLAKDVVSLLTTALREMRP